MSRCTVGIVMPVLDEAARIDESLARLRGQDDLVVVDGESTDDTVARAEAAGARVIRARRGRGPQLNAGAAALDTDVLLFLHCDVVLPEGACQAVGEAMEDPEVVGGAFTTWTRPEQPLWWAPAMHIADIRSRVTRYPYGDQGIFVRRTVFETMEGFADIPLMEDLDFSRRLARRGRTVRIRRPVQVSGRRFTRRPVYYTLVMNTFPMLWRLGVPPERLARWYEAIR